MTLREIYNKQDYIVELMDYIEELKWPNENETDYAVIVDLIQDRLTHDYRRLQAQADRQWEILSITVNGKEK